MLSEEMAPLVPPGLQGKEDVLFGNLHELFTFHSDIFLKDLENCISTTELVALCFVQRVSCFFIFCKRFLNYLNYPLIFSEKHFIVSIHTIVKIYLVPNV